MHPLSVSKKTVVGATCGRPRSLRSKLHRHKAKNRVISLREIRKTSFFDGRPKVAPTLFTENRVL